MAFRLLTITELYQKLLREQQQQNRQTLENSSNPISQIDHYKQDVDKERGLWRSGAGLFTSVSSIPYEIYYNLKRKNPLVEPSFKTVARASIRAYPYYAPFSMAFSGIIVGLAPWIVDYYKKNNSPLNDALPESQRLNRHDFHWECKRKAYFLAGFAEGFVSGAFGVFNMHYSIHNAAHNPIVQTPLNVLKVLTFYDFYKSAKYAVPMTMAKNACFWGSFIDAKKYIRDTLGVKAGHDVPIWQTALIGGLSGMYAGTLTYWANLLIREMSAHPDQTLRKFITRSWQDHASKIKHSAQDPKNNRISAYFPHTMQTSYQFFTKTLNEGWFNYVCKRGAANMALFSIGIAVIDNRYDAFQKDGWYGFFGMKKQAVTTVSSNETSNSLLQAGTKFKSR